MITTETRNAIQKAKEEAQYPLPLIINPPNPDTDLLEWTKEHLDFLEEKKLQHGGILLRGFKVPSIEVFEQFTNLFGDKLEEYKERSTPRTEVSGRIYTSTEYPANQHIPLHNENSYAHSWAKKIWFHCVKKAEQGGETPIADSRLIYKMLDRSIVKKFEEKKVMYVRNNGAGIDLSWQEIFQTNSREEVEAYCKATGMTCEWLDNDRLRTKAVRNAVARHPVTGEMLWFNQVHLFHVSNLPEEVREWLLMKYKLEDLPRNAYYGDGTPIEDSVLAEIREVLKEATVTFPWEEGDIMYLDNMLTMHARTPFKGKRKIVVAMADVTSDYGI